MKTTTRGLLGLSLLLAALAGCDKQAKVCRTGEGVDALYRWGACNESCVGKDNAESCAAAKVHAAAACALTVKQGKPNQHACKTGCAAGDAPSCAVK